MCVGDVAGCSEWSNCFLGGSALGIGTHPVSLLNRCSRKAAPEGKAPQFSGVFRECDLTQCTTQLGFF